MSSGLMLTASEMILIIEACKTNCVSSLSLHGIADIHFDTKQEEVYSYNRVSPVNTAPVVEEDERFMDSSSAADCVADELADLMLKDPLKYEEEIERLNNV